MSCCIGRIYGRRCTDLLRDVQTTRGRKERLLWARTSSPVFVSGTGRSWSVDRLATLYPAYYLYPYALVLLPSGAPGRRTHAITLRRSVHRACAGHSHVPAGRAGRTVGASVVWLDPQAAAKTVCHLLSVTGGVHRRSFRATAIQPSPDPSCELVGRECGHIIFARRHGRT